jgi:DNA polymerase III epsilon subunit-like protein
MTPMIAHILDTETSGLIENRSMDLARLPEIIEFYGIVANLDEAKILSSLHRMIKPSRPLIMERGDKKGKTITEITGISNDMLVHAPPFADVADVIFAFIEEAPVVIAQNASFDVEMLDIEAERLGRKINWPPVLCTIEQSVYLKGYRLNLGDLHQLMTGESFAGAHRARADVEALFRICVAMHKRSMI